MKKILNVFFVVLGVIFFILILIGTYFFITDPLNLKPLLFGEKNTATQTEDSSTASGMSDSQKEALQKIGVDPADVPSEITPEQEACFEAKLGVERVAEIKAGASPTATDYFQARDCI